MKKIISAILLFGILASLCLFTACSGGSTYEPVESTEEESRVMMRLSLDGETYEVKYELYRALFLNCASDYSDKGEGFFDTDEGKAAATKINETVISLITDIYAALHLARSIGEDPFSKAVDNRILELIADDVNNDHYGGDYDKYLADLAAMNMNYAVQELLLRYQIAYDAVLDHYVGSIDVDNPTEDMTEGALEYTKDDVLSFYNSDECVKVSIITLNGKLPLEDVEKIRNNIASKPTESEALSYAVSCTLSDPGDIFKGALIGSESIDYAFFSEVKEEAFALSLNETSKVIKISYGTTPEYWVLYRTDKTEDYYNECYSDIEDAFVSHKIGMIIASVKEKLSASAEKTEIFEDIDYSEIKMK